MTHPAEDRWRAAGFDSRGAAERSLENLKARRTAALKQRIGAASMGDSDFGGGIPLEKWRAMNSAIDGSNELEKLETEIERIGRLLDG